MLSSEAEIARPSGSAATWLTGLGMSFEDAQALAGGEVPEPQGAVAGAGERASVGQRRDVGDPIGMSFEDAQALAGGEVPEPQGIVVRG